MNKIKIVLAVCCLMMGLTACGVAKEPDQKAAVAGVNSAFPMVITDSYDREVRIEKEPLRIISLAPNITETLFALEKGALLVGRTDYCDYPAETAQIESVGTLKAPSIEKISELKPDLVIASTHFSKDTLKKLEELGIPTVVLYGKESFDGVYETISKVGQILSCDEKAGSIIAGMKGKVDNVIKRVADQEKPSVYYVVRYGKSGDYTAGKGTFIGHLMEIAGARNAAEDTDQWKYSLERLIEKNPGIMICPAEGGFKQGLETTSGYKELTAVKEGKLFEIDQNLIERQGPRLADGLEAMARIIHPEAMK